MIIKWILDKIRDTNWLLDSYICINILKHIGIYSNSLRLILYDFICQNLERTVNFVTGLFKVAYNTKLL